MFNRRKHINAIWLVVSIFAVISMVAYLLLPLIVSRPF